MDTGDDRAVNAIWKTELHSAEEKLVLYQLASKHELGERYSSSWKSVHQFLEDFEVRWCAYSELKDSTQLSDTKLQRTITELQKRSYLEARDAADISMKGAGKNTSYAITPKIFEDFSTVLEKRVSIA